MARKRNGWVPAGEAFGSLDGPEKALAKSSPQQARHHFTRADQVHQLVGASEADPDLGFMARLMALCSLPRTNPGNQHQYKRQNGPFKLIMIAGGDNKLPFGNLPRLLLAWVCTEAVRTQKRELVLGKSLAEFMRTLGIYNSGGKPQTRLRNQMDRLFYASVQLIYEDERIKTGISSFVADHTEFWWDPKRPNEPTLWESKIRLGEDFFNEIIRHPVPLDMNTLKALKGTVKLSRILGFWRRNRSALELRINNLGSVQGAEQVLKSVNLTVPSDRLLGVSPSNVYDGEQGRGR